jgi:chromosome segregation ATPase
VAETLLNQQESKIDPNANTQRPNSRVKKIAGIILSLLMIVLTIYVLNLQHQNYNTLSKSTDLALIANDRATANYLAYVGKYKETKIELAETTHKLEEVNRQLDQVATELTTTKGMLSQTQGMLSQTQEENIKLKQELQGLDNLRSTENAQNVSELQAKIDAMKANDSQISLQLADLKNQLRAFEADFSNPAEGRSLIVLFRNKINLVISRLRYLKQQAFFAKVAAQKEKDRLASLNGNSGYVLRNGKLQNPNGTNKSFAIDVNIVQ